MQIPLFTESPTNTTSLIVNMTDNRVRDKKCVIDLVFFINLNHGSTDQTYG